jgi:hypothetical protein
MGSRVAVRVAPKFGCADWGPRGSLLQVRAGTGRLSGRRRYMSMPVAGALPPALFTAQPRSITRARLSLRKLRRIPLPPR